MITGLIGMVHLGPLPGSPRATDLEKTLSAAVLDATRLAAAGFDALMIENFGDAPFFADRVPDVTVAAMTRAALSVAGAVDLPIGINVLRNDAEAAVSIASATGARFVRVNVLSGTMFTDQGPITGRAAEVSRLRAALAPDLQILADVMVKHATPPPGVTLEQAATDLWERAGADGIVVSGPGTGRPIDIEDLRRVHTAVPAAPLYAGSGATAETVADLMGLCAGVIVGTATKAGGAASGPVDPDRAAAIVEAAR